MPGKSVLWVLLFMLCTGTVLEPAEGIARYSRTLLELINTYRQEHGLNALRSDDGLNQLARQHSFEMFRQKRISHLSFKERFERADSDLCVENVGGNHSNARQQFDAWRRSSAHNQNMLRDSIQKAGVAEIGNYVTFFACR